MINHLWYLTHHKHHCKLQWDSARDFNDEFIKKELGEINPQYKNLPLTFDNFIKVAAEFHTDIYLKVEADIEIHESRMWLLKHHTRFATFSFICVLLLLCSMLLFYIPAWIIQASTILVLLLLMICLLLVGLDYPTQIRCYNKLHKLIHETKKMIKK